MTALVLAGGDVETTAELRRLAQGADLVVAADSGLRHAVPLGVTPELIVGDFDSVGTELLARYPELPRQAHPPEKDLLDLELALSYALEKGMDSIVIVGGLGGRFDQTFAAVLIAARLKQEGIKVRLHSGDQQVFFLAGRDALELSLPKGQRFSVLSLTPASIISIENAEYPLRRHRLLFGVGLGVSNRVVAPPLRLELEAGLVVITVL